MKSQQYSILKMQEWLHGKEYWLRKHIINAVKHRMVIVNKSKRNNVICCKKGIFFLILEAHIGAVFSSSKTTTTNITVWWNHPYQNADLVQSYNVSLRAFDSSYFFQTSVELQTNYTFESSFLPGYLYYFEITSVVFLSESAETIFVKTDAINLVVGKNYSYLFVYTKLI